MIVEYPYTYLSILQPGIIQYVTNLVTSIPPLSLSIIALIVQIFKYETSNSRTLIIIIKKALISGR